MEQNVTCRSEQLARRIALVVGLSVAVGIPVRVNAAPRTAHANYARTRPVRTLGVHVDSTPDYQRYTVLSCGTIMTRRHIKSVGERRLVWREHWPDTMSSANAPDSIAKKAALRATESELRRCMATQTPERVPPGHLVTAGTVWLTAKEHAKASAAFARAVTNAAREPVSQRALLLSKIIQAYLNADSVSIAETLHYMAQLDALGPAVAGRRLAMHNAIFNAVESRDSVALMEREATGALQAYAQLEGDARIEWIQYVTDAFVNQGSLLVRKGQHAEALAYLEQAHKTLDALNPNKRQWIVNRIWRVFVALSAARLYGTQARPIEASWVYWPGKSVPDSSIVRPAPGRFSLYAFSQYNAGVTNSNKQSFDVLQRIVAQFGKQIDVTILEETKGFDVLHQTVVKPEQESRNIAEFYHQYLSIPAPVAIYNIPVIGKRSDGALERGENPNRIQFVQLVLVDPQGKICYVWGVLNGSEKRLRDVIAKGLAQKT